MNLKDAFRYQTFLERNFSRGCSSILDRTHAYDITKKHLRSKANPEAEDIEETVDNGEFFRNDDVIRFLLSLVDERSKLTEAIDKAKRSVPFDIDAAVETNKFRQRVASCIGSMLEYQAKDSVSKETGYKFNVDGNQTTYYYDVENRYAEAYDRAGAKVIMKDLSTSADAVSTAIDSAMINTVVDYIPPYNVNDSFDDMMESFLTAHPTE